MNKFLGRFIVLLIFLFLFSTLAARPALAVKYDLIAPSGTLTRGQNVDFTINVDTEGQSMTNATIGMTYQSSVLQYVSTTPGNTFTSVSTDTLTPGQLIFNASSANGFSGSGTFATVTFTLIATAPGSTELCVLFNPTPTQAPSTPAPTKLPKSGSFDNVGLGALAGAGLILLAAAGLVLANKSQVRPRKHRQK